MDEDSYSLSWSSQERAAQLLAPYQSLLTTGDFHDVTLLSADHHLLRAHRVVLAACSPVFRSIFSKNSVSGLQLYMHGMEAIHLQGLLDFMYSGSTRVPREALQDFLGVARDLGVMGLMDKHIEQHREKPVDDMQFKEEIGSMFVPLKQTNAPICVQENTEATVVSDPPSRQETVDKPIDVNPPKHPPGPTPNTNGYSCATLNFPCSGHASLKEHIKSAQIPKKSVVEKQKVKVSSYNITEERRKLLEDMDRLKSLKQNLVESNPYECKECKIVLPTEYNFKRHNLQLHSHREMNCDKCDTIFKNKSDFRHHRLSCRIPCICGKTFRKKFEYDGHYEKHHSSVQKELKQAHTNHLKMKTELKFFEGIIKAENDQTQNIKQVKESKLHPQTKSALIFQCDACKKLFRTNESLKSHYKSSHLKVLEQFTCDLCSDAGTELRDRLYSGMVALKKHFVNDHQDAYN